MMTPEAPSYYIPAMRRALSELADRTFDVVIVGGGISGACCAHDASLRGLSVALLERNDFGGATSSSSSKLLHGGIRYLQQLRPDKVVESARERAFFQRIAPHLTSWVPFLIPTEASLLRGRWFLQLGIWTYDALASRENDRIFDLAKRVPPSTFYRREELQHLVPQIRERDDVTGAHLLYESHLYSSERMTLAFLKSAAQNGAVIANHADVNGILRNDDSVSGVKITDRLTGNTLDVQARFVLNASGPWLPRLSELLGFGSLARPVTGFSKGSHIVVKQIVQDYGLALPTTRRSSAFLGRGGRHIFIIPWRGHSLIGTTNRPHDGSIDEVSPTEDDINDLLSDVEAALPGISLSRDDVCHAFSGLYPLTASQLQSEIYQGSGDYQIIDHSRNGGINGAISILGAKYTTARRLADLATTQICERLGRQSLPCRTHQTPLIGGDIDDLVSFIKDTVLKHAHQLDAETVRHLIHHYGTETDLVIAGVHGVPGGLRHLTSTRESIEAEVVFAVEKEMAVMLDDVVFRRTGLGAIGYPGDACLQRCAEIMRERLGWNDAQMTKEIQRTRSLFPV
jgi:glycerol-3-phosphate dehydrogenase